MFRHYYIYLLLFFVCIASSSFAQVEKFKVNGNASKDDCNCYTLTPDAQTMSGSVWSVAGLDLNKSFDFSFDVYLGTKDGAGADGIAFVLQSVSTSVGGSGGGGGFEGISPSVGVMIDTWNNGDKFDIPADHISLNKNGDANHSTANNLAGPVGVGDIEDGQFHSLRVVWDAVWNTMKVYFDDGLMFSHTEDFVNTVFGGNPNMFWGMVGATGGSSNLQRFCFTVDADFELVADGNLCLGDTTFFQNNFTVIDTLMSSIWDFGDGIKDTAVDTYHVYDAPGTYNVNLRIEDGNGCTNDTTIVIEIMEPPTALVIADTLNCEKSVIQIDASGSSGIGNLIYDWSGPAGFLAGNANNKPQTDLPGEYTLLLRTDAHGCYDSVTFEVAIDTIKPHVDAGKDTLIDCEQNSILLAPLIGKSDSTFVKWRGPGIVGDDQVEQVEVDTEGFYVYEVYNFKNGCTSYDTIEVKKHYPIVGVFYDIQYTPCGASEGLIEMTFINGGTSDYTYSIDGVNFQTEPRFTGLGVGNYPITVIDANGCSYQEDLYVGTLTGITDADIRVQPGVCGAKGSVEVVSVTGGEAPYTYSMDDVNYQASNIFNNLDSGNVIVYIKDVNNCLFTKSVTMDNYPSPTITLDTVVDLNCYEGDNGIIDVSVSGVGPLTIDWNTNPVRHEEVLTFIPAGSYRAIVIDTNECADTLYVDVEQPDELVLSKIEIPASCSDSMGWAVVIPTGGVKPYSYEWDTNPVQFGDTAHNLLEGSYVCKVVDNNGCSNVIRADISEPQPINLDLSYTPSGCVVNTGKATVTASGGVGQFDYQWGTSPVQDSSTAIELKGDETYTLTVFDENDCSVDTSIYIPYDNAPTMDVINVQNVTCSDSLNGSITVAVTGGTYPYRYYYNSVPAQRDSIAVGLDSGLYMIIVKDNIGCKVTKYQQITKPSPIETSVLATGDPCNQVIGSIDLESWGGTGLHTYSWNTTPPQTSQDLTGLDSGLYTVTITDENGCLKYVSQEIEHIPGPVIDSVKVTPIHCEDGSDGAIEVFASAVNTISYTWNTSPVQSTSAITNLKEGAYIVEIVDMNGCKIDSLFDLSYLYPLPVFSLPEDTAFCKGDSILIENTVAANTYEWQPTGEVSQMIYAKKGGKYFLTIEDNGCYYTDSIVIREDILPNLELGPDTGFCGPFVWSYDVTVPGTDVIYKWEDGSANPKRDINAGGLFGVGITRQTCQITDSVTIIAQEEIGLTMPNDSTLCEGEELLLTPKMEYVENPTYVWNGLASTSANLAATTSGTYIFEITDGYCYESGDVTLRFLEVPLPELGDDIVICEGERVVIASGYPQFDNVWNTESTASEIEVNTEGVYWVEVTNEVCIGFDSVRVFTLDRRSSECSPPELFIANTFTPNGDGDNEFFGPSCYYPDRIVNYDFGIYDRWGKRVFQTQDIHEMWGGLTVNGDFKEDVYSWRIIYQTLDPVTKDVSEPIQLRGLVNLLK